MKDRSFMNPSAAAPASPDRQILTQAGELRSSVSALRDGIELIYSLSPRLRDNLQTVVLGTRAIIFSMGLK
jgi:hypothetical protein